MICRDPSADACKEKILDRMTAFLYDKRGGENSYGKNRRADAFI